MIESLLRALGVALVIFILGEVAKRSTTIAAVLASFPIATVATAYLLYTEGESADSIGAFVLKTALLIPPSFIFFIGFPLAIKRGISLAIAMPVLLVLMTMCYAIYIMILRKYGILMR